MLLSGRINLSAPCDQFSIFVQQGFNLGRILRAAAQQDLAPCRESFQIRVGIEVERLGLGQINRSGYLRSDQQVIDDFNQAVIEVSLRVAKLLVGLLEERVEAFVDSDNLCGVEGGPHLDKGRVAFIVGRGDRQLIPLSLCQEFPRCLLEWTVGGR